MCSNAFNKEQSCLIKFDPEYSKVWLANKGKVCNEL